MAQEEKIRRRSYEIWLQEGCPDGRALQHWVQAKAEIERERPKPKAMSFAYHTVLYRSEEWQRAVQPRPRISTPPQVSMANRVAKDRRPAA